MLDDDGNDYENFSEGNKSKHKEIPDDLTCQTPRNVQKPEEMTPLV